LFDYREHAPPPSLTPWVRCLWTLTGLASAEVEPQPVVPDGCMELVFNLADPFKRKVSGDAGGFHTQPHEMVVGQLAQPVVIAPTGAVNLVGIRLHPWGASGFLGVPAAELRGELLPLDDVRREFARLSERVASAGDSSVRVATLAAALESSGGRLTPPEPALRAAVAMLLEGGPLPSLRGVASRLGRSVRWVQRGFEHTVGLNPKMLARIARVQRAIGVATRAHSLSWAAVAAEAGYFDHSHLVRDFKMLVGCTPSEFDPRPGSLTDVFLDS
jgi:AraC-like DNA-binding protein